MDEATATTTSGKGAANLLGFAKADQLQRFEKLLGHENFQVICKSGGKVPLSSGNGTVQ